MLSFAPLRLCGAISSVKYLDSMEGVLNETAKIIGFGRRMSDGVLYSCSRSDP